jgi:hypothetical protein
MPIGTEDSISAETRLTGRSPAIVGKGGPQRAALFVRKRLPAGGPGRGFSRFAKGQ